MCPGHKSSGNKKYDGEKERRDWVGEREVKQVGVCAQDKRPLLFTSRLAAPGRIKKERERGWGKNRGSH